MPRNPDPPDNDDQASDDATVDDADSDSPNIDDAHRAAVEGYGDITDDDVFDASDGEVMPGRTRGGQSGVFMTKLADALRDAGQDVNEYRGWKTRGRRGTGLWSGPHAIILHHTASGRGTNGQRDADFLADDHKHAPISNLYLDRQGTWWVLAAGATNTNGKGGPWGPVPVDGANVRVIGIEAANNGIGEPWSTAMQDAYVAGVAAVAERYDIDTTNILSHHEWAPTRKVDPAGPSRFGSINTAKTWDMNLFREAVSEARNEEQTVAKVESRLAAGDTYVIQPGDAWWPIAEKTMGNPAANWLKLAEANGGPDRVLLAGAVLTIPGDDDAPRPKRTQPTPTFPGEASKGMRGDVVLTWQRALVAQGVLDNTPGNHDGVFGNGMFAAVLELQQSWGWSDADGIAGPGTWRRLHADE